VGSRAEILAPPIMGPTMMVSLVILPDATFPGTTCQAPIV